MATGVIGRRGFTTMQGVIDLMYVCNICSDLLSIDSGRMTGYTEVIPGQKSGFWETEGRQ
jgi:hypothetical protein